nr:M56 family metallopeptidase [uncultured Undibacterium sp.]
MMSNLTPFLPELSVLGVALLHVLWQASLIALATAVGLRLLRSASAQSRYLLLCLALLLCIALPVQYLVSHSGQSVEYWQSDSLAALNVDTLARNDPDSKAGEASDTATLLTSFGNWHWQAWEPRFASVAPFLVLLWAIGVAGMALRMCAGLLWVRQRVQRGSHQSDVLWQAKLQQLAQRMNIRGAIQLGISDEVESPFTVGWWRPMVIFPSALMTGMPSELIEALLAHEVAHVKRMDYLVNLLQSAIEILLFFHPAVWWLSRQIRIEREQIADDLAAGLLGEPRRLALALSELEQFQFSHPQLAQAAHGGNLMSRIKRLIRPASPAGVWTWKMAVPLLSLSAACSLIYAQAATTNTMNTSSASPLVVSNAIAALPVATPVPLPVSVADTQNAKMANAKSDASAKTFFALVKPDNDRSSFVHTDRKGTREIEVLRKKTKDEFLWFSENGQSYIIKDSAILQQANAAYQPMEVLGEQMDAQGKKMEVHGKVMEEIGKQMEAVSAKEYPVDTALEARMRAFEKKMEASSRKIEAAVSKLELAKTDEQRAEAQKRIKEAEAEMREVGQKLRKGSQAYQLEHEKLRSSLQPLEELGQKMNQASQPMKALGEEMNQLGKQMDALAVQAEKQVRDLIQQAKQKGLVLAVKDI